MCYNNYLKINEYCFYKTIISKNKAMLEYDAIFWKRNNL